MIEAAENVAKKYHISRMNKMTLRIAVISWHQNMNNGNISQEILPFKVKVNILIKMKVLNLNLLSEHLADLNHF